MSLVSPAVPRHCPAFRPVFDPRDIRCKTPFGAAVCGETVTMNIRPLAAENFSSGTLVLQQDYASRNALRELLDESYRNYERGVNRWAYAHRAKTEENDEAEYLALISEAIAYLGKTQMYARKLITELNYYDD